MIPPLATLTRGAMVVRLHDGLTFPLEAPQPEGPHTDGGDSVPAKRWRPVAFARQGDAEIFLRSWKSTVGAMGDLRRALGRSDRGIAVFRLSDDEVIRELAVAIARGSVLVTESVLPTVTSIPLPQTVQGMTSGLVARPLERAPAEFGPPTVPLVVVPALPAAPALPLLPLLEELQIEGARVLPEVWQTLEQIHLTMEKLSLATVSLAPTPTGVPPIATTMTEASAAITTTLDGL